MAKQFFSDSESNGDGDKLFASEYLAANKKELGREFTITEVVKARSGKGYMIHTEHFICWVWNKSKLTQNLLEALNVYVSTSKGFHLFAILTNTNRDCFTIGVNTNIEARWYDMGNGSYSLTQQDALSTGVGNPFLPNALLPPLVEVVPDSDQEPPIKLRRKRA